MLPDCRYVRINNRTLAQRSTVDNVWRVWVRLPMAWFDDDHHRPEYQPGTLAWVPVGASKRLKEVLEQLRASSIWTWANAKGGLG